MNQAVDFVLSKVNLAVGTREKSNQAPVAYEMPPDVVREAIVNAVAIVTTYLTKYIERMGTGVGDMIERCRNAGLLEPEFYLTDGFLRSWKNALHM